MLTLSESHTLFLLYSYLVWGPRYHYIAATYLSLGFNLPRLRLNLVVIHCLPMPSSHV